jgi:hypothetical protein
MCFVTCATYSINGLVFITEMKSVYGAVRTWALKKAVCFSSLKDQSVTPDVLDIVLTQKISLPVYLTSCSALSSDHLPVLIDTACRISFHHPPDRPDFRRTDWTNFQTHFEDQIPFDLELHNGMAIDTCVEKFPGEVLKALAAFTSKCRPRDDPRPPDTGWYSGRDTPEESAAEEAADHQRPRSESPGQPPTEVGDPSAKRVEERPVECYTRIPRSRRPVAVEDDQTGGESSYSIFSPDHPVGNRSLRLCERRSPCRHCGGSIAAGDRSFGPGSY